MVRILSALVFSLWCAAHASDTDSCPAVTPISPFHLEKFFSGRWFEMARYANFEFDKTTDCIYYEFGFDGHVYKFNITEVKKRNVSTSNGLADYAPGSNNIGLIYESILLEKEAINSTYSILDIDYDTYALLIFCDMDAETNEKIESAWILSRTFELEGVRTKIKDLIKKYEFLDVNMFIWYNFSDKICLLERK